MENKIFKQLIETNARKLNFEKLKTAFVRESDDALVFLIPRKSGYSNLYYLRLKVALKPAEKNFDKFEFIKHDVGDIMMSIDLDNKELFDLENDLTDVERTERVEIFFKSNVDLWVNNMLSKKRIVELHQKENFFLLPYAQSKLGLM